MMVEIESRQNGIAAKEVNSYGELKLIGWFRSLNEFKAKYPDASIIRIDGWIVGDRA